jgi:hypothetical protein
MKVSSLTVAALSLLANPSGTFASSPSSSSRNRKNTVLPWTTVKKIFNPRGGAASPDTSSDSHVLLGRDEEATESLEVSVPLSQSSTLSKNDAPLTRDIEMLTEILSDLVKHENPKVHDLYEEFVGYGRQRYVVLVWCSYLYFVRYPYNMRLLCSCILSFLCHSSIFSQ